MNFEQVLNQKNRFLATTSEKYQVITTQDVIKVLESQGFKLESMTAKRVKKNSDREGYQTHFLRLTHPLFSETALRPELLVKNSYDGTSALELRIGVYRLVCSNGLVTGSNFQTFKIKHCGNVADKIRTASLAILPQMRSAIVACEVMSSVTMSDVEQYRLAVEASKIVDKTLLDVSDLLKVNRREDQFNDLFTVFNRIQENLIAGSFVYINESNKAMKARRITSPQRLIEVNHRLWDVAAQFLTKE